MFTKILKKEEIEKIKIVFAENGENIEDVKNRVNCDCIINGGTFKMSDRSLDSGVKLDGKLLKTGYSCEGFAISGNSLIWSYEGQGFNDWFGQWSCYRHNGANFLLTNSGERAQMGIGTDSNGNIVISAVSEKNGENAGDFFRSAFANCKNAILLDGGGSTQWIFEDNKNISARKVPWYICFWLKTEKKTTKELEKAMKEKIRVRAKKKISVYNKNGELCKNEYIAKNDICLIGNVNDDLLIDVEYPTPRGAKLRYVKSLEGFTQA